MDEAGLGEEGRPAFFLSADQVPQEGLRVAIRTAGAGPLAVAGAVRGALREQDPDITLAQVQSMEDRIGATLAQPRFRTGMVSAFALVGLLFGVAPADPLSLGGSSVVLLVTAVAAVLVPALRAVRVEDLGPARGRMWREPTPPIPGCGGPAGPGGRTSRQNTNTFSAMTVQSVNSSRLARRAPSTRSTSLSPRASMQPVHTPMTPPWAWKAFSMRSRL